MAETTGFKPIPPIDQPDDVEHRRLIAAAVQGLFDGRSNNFGSVTLTANQATTVVTDKRVGSSSKLFLFPKTANAATDFGSGNMYISSVGKETFTITHTNDANADKTFDYIVIGG